MTAQDAKDAEENVLIVHWHDLGRYLGVYGHPDVSSPRLDRLAAEGKRLQAMLQAVETIRPKLDDFYASLSNEQKARFNTIGRQLFAAR